MYWSKCFLLNTITSNYIGEHTGIRPDVGVFKPKHVAYFTHIVSYVGLFGKEIYPELL